MDEGLCEKEMAYARLTVLFSDNRLSYDVCEKACSLFIFRSIEDLSYSEDRDIGKLELQLVDSGTLTPSPPSLSLLTPQQRKHAILFARGLHGASPVP